MIEKIEFFQEGAAYFVSHTTILNKINEIINYINTREELEDSVLEQPHD